MAEYVSIRPVRPHRRCFFEDGTKIDLPPEKGAMDAELRKIGDDRLPAFRATSTGARGSNLLT